MELDPLVLYLSKRHGPPLARQPRLDKRHIAQRALQRPVLTLFLPSNQSDKMLNFSLHALRPFLDHLHGLFALPVRVYLDADVRLGVLFSRRDPEPAFCAGDVESAA